MKKNGINLAYANTSSPSPSIIWTEVPEEVKLNKIVELLDELDANWNEKYKVISAKNNGFVTIDFLKSIPVSERSNYILSIESELCSRLDDSITIWVAPVGDKSSLRNLRGIEVKSI